MNEVKIVQLTPFEFEKLFFSLMEKYDRIKELNQQDNILHTKRAAASRLGVSYNTLQRKINSGLIKERPDGKITEKALNDYLNM